MTDQLHSQNLVPFKKRRGPYHIPGMTGENEVHALDVDHDLTREEERYIRHYLGYADALLKSAPGEVAELPEKIASPQESSSFEKSAAQSPSTPEISGLGILEAEQPESSEPNPRDKAA